MTDNSNNDVSSALDDLMGFLAPSQNRADVKYEAVKVVSRGMSDRYVPQINSQDGASYNGVPPGSGGWCPVAI